MTVSIVIPNWNGKKLLEENLPVVLRVGVDEVVVVDDGSTDGSVATLQKFKVQNANFKVVQNRKNLGFAKAVNKGVKEARGDIVILLNTDVRPESGLLDAILPHFKDKKVFAVSFAEQQWSWSMGIWRDGFVEHKPGPKTKTTHPTFWVSGGSGAFRKSIWNELEGFNSVFAPFYWEDIDLSYRAAKRGYKLLWEPKAHVVHGHEGTIGKHFSREYIQFIQERNQLIFIWKNIASPKMFREHLNGTLKRFLKSPGYIKVVLAALSKLPEIKRSRNSEIRESEITDEQIFTQFT